MRQQIFTQRPEHEIRLHVNESILFVMHRHIVHLLVRLAAPALVLILSAATAIFRAAGGQFFVGDAVPSGQTGALDLWLVLATGALVIGAFLLRRRRGWSPWLGGLAGLAVVWLVFRLRGGRVLSYSVYASQGLDLANVILILIALGAAALCVYLYLDWKTDEFILTTDRVIYNRELPLVRRVQEQIPLNNIQQVKASTETYIQHWLSLGKLQIKSAAVGFTIYFEDAHNPEEMQRRIMAQVKQVRSQENDAVLQGLIESALDGTARERVRREREVAVDRVVAPGMLQWLFPQNPQIDREREIYIWHPHWAFLIKAIWLPVTLWAVTLGLALFALMGGLLGGLFGVGLLALATLVFGGWVAWQVEDHRNDRYILTPTEVIDVSKRPLGPEDRRTASLEMIQNVTYKTTLIGRILGYGDVLVQTAGGGEGFTFYDAPQPGQLVDMVTSYQLAYKRSSKIRSLEDTVKLIQYYDAHYRTRATPPRAPQAGAVGD